MIPPAFLVFLLPVRYNISAFFIVLRDRCTPLHSSIRQFWACVCVCLCVCALGPCVVFPLASDHPQLTPQCVTWETYCFNSDKDQRCLCHRVAWDADARASYSLGCTITDRWRLPLHWLSAVIVLAFAFGFVFQQLYGSCFCVPTILLFLLLIFRIFLLAVFLHQQPNWSSANWKGRVDSSAWYSDALMHVAPIQAETSLVCSPAAPPKKTSLCLLCSAWSVTQTIGMCSMQPSHIICNAGC